MSYLSKPGSAVVHIPALGGFGGTRTINGIKTRTLEALCTAYFADPHLTSYFGDRKPGQRVCGHCKRSALRTASHLLTYAQGANP